MDLKIRLSDTLDARLRAHADMTGATLNSIVCLAVDAFLPGAFVAEKPVSVGSKRPATPKPKLGPKPTKAERSALAGWHRLHGSDQGELLAGS